MNIVFSRLSALGVVLCLILTFIGKESTMAIVNVYADYFQSKYFAGPLLEMPWFHSCTDDPEKSVGQLIMSFNVMKPILLAYAWVIFLLPYPFILMGWYEFTKALLDDAAWANCLKSMSKKSVPTFIVILFVIFNLFIAAPLGFTNFQFLFTSLAILALLLSALFVVMPDAKL